MSPPRIFISYRREDSSGHAGRLYDALADHFGSENVFIDVDTIRIGSDFADTIEQAIGNCDAVVALIGRDWTTAALAGGQRRLEDTGDFVRLELESALAHDIAVVPVAVRGAAFPEPDELPDSLKPLARRQGIELRDSAWRDDVNRLIRRLEGLTAATPDQAHPAAPTRRSRRARLLLVGVAVAVAVIAALLALVVRGGGSASGTPLKRLLAGRPQEARPCQRAPRYGTVNVLAKVDCFHAPVDASYYLFASRQLMDSWYDAQTVDIANGDCRSAPFRDEASYGRGRRVCYFKPNGEAQTYWTDDETNIGGEASSYGVSRRKGAASLVKLWNCCYRPR